MTCKEKNLTLFKALCEAMTENNILDPLSSNMAHLDEKYVTHALDILLPDIKWVKDYAFNLKSNPESIPS